MTFFVNLDEGLLVNHSGDSHIRFKMGRTFDKDDPNWDLNWDKERNLTVWLDQDGQLTAAMGKIEVKRRLDTHTGWASVDRHLNKMGGGPKNYIFFISTTQFYTVCGF